VLRRFINQVAASYLLPMQMHMHHDLTSQSQQRGTHSVRRKIGECGGEPALCCSLERLTTTRQERLTQQASPHAAPTARPGGWGGQRIERKHDKHYSGANRRCINLAEASFPEPTATPAPSASLVLCPLHCHPTAPSSPCPPPASVHPRLPWTPRAPPSPRLHARGSPPQHHAATAPRGPTCVGMAAGAR